MVSALCAGYDHDWCQGLAINPDGYLVPCDCWCHVPTPKGGPPPAKSPQEYHIGHRIIDLNFGTWWCATCVSGPYPFPLPKTPATGEK